MWLTGLVAPRHVGSSQTRAQTRVPCIGRQILNHCATREALHWVFEFHIEMKFREHTVNPFSQYRSVRLVTCPVVCANTISLFSTLFRLLEEYVSLLFNPPRALASADLPSVVDLPVLSISYKRNHTTHGLLCLFVSLGRFSRFMKCQFISLWLNSIPLC